MKINYNPVQGISNLLRNSLVLILMLLGTTSMYAQTTTLSTVPNPPYNGTNGAGTNFSVTFAIENTNASPILLTDVDSWINTTDANGNYSLWYSATSLSGTPTPIATPIWTQIAQVVGMPAPGTSGINDVFTGLSLVIPGNTTYRFAFWYETTASHYSGTGTGTGAVSPSIFSSGGVNLLLGDVQIGGLYVGYGGPNTPRWFTGAISFEPFGPCTNPPTAGTTTSTANPACANTNFTLSLAGSTFGSGQTYQWEISPNGSSWTPISGANSFTYTTSQASSNYYRCVVTCGASTTSTPLHVVTPSLVSGTYTINGALPTGGLNFQTFNAAVNYMSCGINGPITFNVVAGTYNEQVSIPVIGGASAVNTITFNGNNATLTYSSANSGAPATLELNGTDYVRVNTLNIIATGATYAFGAHLWNNADNNMFTTCVFTAPVNGSTTTHVPFSISGSATSGITAGDAGSNNIITGCTMNNGYYNTTIVGNSTAASTGNQIINCTMKDYYIYGCYVGYQNGAVIRGNLFERPTRTTLSTFYGVFITLPSTSLLVERNTIRNPYGAALTNTGTAYGIYCAEDGTAGNENRFFNNLIYNFTGHGTHYGMYMLGADYFKVYHNTIAHNNIAATTGTSYGIYSSGTIANTMDIRNNIVYISRGGTLVKYGIYLTNTTVRTINNNVIFYPAATGGVKNIGFMTSGYTTLATWQAASGYDMASLSVDPLFTNPATGNFMPTNSTINNIGANVGVTNDILGSARTLASPDPGAYEFSVGGLDASISWVAPTSPSTTGLKTITVNILNTQTITINSVNLTYTNGVTPVTQNFTGLSIPAGGNQNLSFTVQYNLTASTSLTATINNVNTVADNIPGNNSVTQNICIGLSGNYTINNGAPASSTNFVSFASAISALSCGVAGPVIFDVAPTSGPYSEQVEITPINGMSSVNTVTFNGNNRTLIFNATVSTAPHTLSLNGADNFTFNNLIVEGTGLTYALVVHLWNNADNNTFNNCTFNAPANDNSTTQSAFSLSGSATSAITAGNSGSNNIVNGCTMFSGYYNTVIMGNATTPSTGNQVINCTMIDYYIYGCYIGYQNGAIFRGNTFHRPTRTTLSTFYGIYIINPSTGLLVEKNRISNPFGGAPTNTGTAYGIYCGEDGTLGNENRFFNNLIYNFTGHGTHYGMYMTIADYFKAYHNTIVHDYTAATAGTTYGIYSSGTVAGTMDIRNNIVYISRGGSGIKYGIYFANATARTSNNNVIYFPTATLGTLNYGFMTSGYTSLAAWQAATGYDLSSVSVDPEFSSPGTGEYLPYEISINNIGANVGVSTDIDGNSRLLASPDPGAYELQLHPINMGATALVTPSAGDCISSTQQVIITIRNYGINTINFAINPVTVTCNITGTATATLSGVVSSGILAPGSSLNVTLSGTANLGTNGNYTFNAYTTVSGDGQLSNDDMNPVTLTKSFSVGSITSSTLNHCISNPTPILTFGGGTGGNIQWQSSTVGVTGPWTNVGTGGDTYSPATLTQGTYFQVNYYCEAQSATSNVMFVDVIDPQVTSTTGAVRCGAGTVTLNATVTSGLIAKWFETISGGALLGTGNNFTTPMINATTNYYVAASSVGSPTSFNLYPFSGGTTCAGGNMFDITPNATMNITGFDINSNATVGTSIPVKVYYRVGGFTGVETTPGAWTLHQTMNVTATGANTPLNIPINPLLLTGGTAYGIYIYYPAQYTTLGATPVTISNADMSVYLGIGLCSEFGGLNLYRAINGKIYYSTECTSVRQPVAATLTPSVPVNATTSDEYICSGNPTTISAASAHSGYGYTWSSIPAGFSGAGAGPLTVNPTAFTTTYQVYAFDPGTQCGALDTVIITTTPNNINTVVTSTPADICPGFDAQLNVAASTPNTVQSYTFVPSSGTYVPVVGGTVVTALEDDDVASGFIPIGFTFYYEGIPYTQLYAQSNGILTFTSIFPASQNNLLATATPRPIIAPLWDDIHGAGGTASYLVTGTPGNQVFTFEWLNYRWFYTNVTPSISFQVKLHEATGRIDFIYQQEPTALNGSEGASIGLAGVTSGHFLSLNGTGPSPTASSMVESNLLNTKPASGQVYSFFPPVPETFTYAWTGSNLSSNSISNPVAQAVPSTTNYPVVVTSLNSGCIKNVSATVNVNPAPTAFSPVSNAVCEGQGMFLNQFGIGATTYSWYGPSGYFASGSFPGAPTLVTSNGTIGVHNGQYMLVVSNSFGCKDTSYTQFDVNSNPLPTLAALDSVSCPGFNDGLFTVGVNAGTSPFFFEYNSGLGNFDLSSNGTFPEDPINLGSLYVGEDSYDVLVSDVNGCTGTLSVYVGTEENESPQWATTPSNIVVGNDAGMCNAVISWPVPTWTDDCPGTTMAQTAGFGNNAAFPIGTTTVTYVVTDAGDANSAPLSISHSFNVSVNDNEFPSVTNCPVSNLTYCNPVIWTPPTFTDNCAGMVVVPSHYPGAILPVGPTTVTYTATDAAGNITYCSFVVNRLAESVVADTITSNREFHNICLGENITLKVGGGSLGAGSSWKWYTGSCGGTLIGTGDSITVSPTSNTVYFVRAEGACNTTLCKQVTVIVSTSGPGNVTITSAPAVGAVGQSGVLTVAAVPGAQFYQYTSNLGHISAILFNGQVGPYLTTSNSVNVTFQLPLQNYQIRVIALNACGRSNTASTHIRGTVPQGTSITSSTGNLVACPNQAVTYTGAAISGSNLYTWTIIPATAGTITSGQGGLVVNVTWAAGFSGSAQLCYHGQTNFNLAGPDYCVTISTNAPTPGAITGNNQPCQGGSGGYTIANVPGATSYNWTTTIPGASVIGTGTTGSATFPAGTFSGNICVTANTSCGVSAASCMPITSGAAGIPDPIAGPSTGVCNLSGINYTVNAPGATGFAWSSADPNIFIASGGSSNSVLVNFLPGFTSGSLDVDVTYACGTTPASIAINGAPAMPVVAPAIICDGTGIQYFASSQSATQFNWTATGALIESCGNPALCSQYFIEWDFGGTLSVTAQNTCGVSPAFSAFGSCRLAQLDANVYPNPTSGQATVEFEAAGQTTYSIKVTDLAGRIIINQEVTSVRGFNQVNIDLTNAGKGLYLVHLNGQDGTALVKRLAVE